MNEVEQDRLQQTESTELEDYKKSKTTQKSKKLKDCSKKQKSQKGTEGGVTKSLKCRKKVDQNSQGRTETKEAALTN